MSLSRDDKSSGFLKELNDTIQLEEFQFCGKNVWRPKKDCSYEKMDEFVDEWIGKYNRLFICGWLPLSCYGGQSVVCGISIIPEYLLDTPRLFLSFAFRLYKKFPEFFVSDFLWSDNSYIIYAAPEILCGLYSVINIILVYINHYINNKIAILK